MTLKNLKRKLHFVKTIIVNILSKSGCILNLPFLSFLAFFFDFFSIKSLKDNKKGDLLIIIYRAGGVHDIYEASKYSKSKKRILFLPRDTLKLILKHFHKNDYPVNSDDKEFIYSKNYIEYIKGIVYWIKKFYGNYSLLTFNFDYFEEIIFRKESHKIGCNCKLLFKECFRSPAEFKVHNGKAVHKYLKYFNSIALYNDNTKNHFALRHKNIRNKIRVIGCARARYSKNLSKKKSFGKAKNILFYYFSNIKGMPVREGKFDYFKDSFKIKKHKPIYWNDIIEDIFDTFIDLSKKYENVNFIIKAKKGEFENYKYIKKINKIDRKNLRYFNEGVGHPYLEKAQVVIGMNSTSILEAIAAKKRIIIPVFNKFRKQPYFQYIYEFPKSLWVNGKKELKIEIEKSIKNDFRLPYKIQGYEKMMKDYFGNIDNSGKKLFNFLNE